MKKKYPSKRNSIEISSIKQIRNLRFYARGFSSAYKTASRKRVKTSKAQERVAFLLSSSVSAEAVLFAEAVLKPRLETTLIKLGYLC